MYIHIHMLELMLVLGLAALQLPLVAATTTNGRWLHADTLAKLHVMDAARYESCPLHAVTSWEYACFLASPNKTAQILQHTPGPFINAREVFARPEMRNNTLYMVGDSLMGNQFTSLGCLLWEADPAITKGHYSVANRGGLWIYSPTYDVQIIFSFSMLLLSRRLTSREGHATLDPRIPVFLAGRHHAAVRKPTFVLLSTGHHYAQGKYDRTCASTPGCEPNSPHMGHFRINIEQAQKLLRQQLASPHVEAKALWRGVPPRHYQGGEWNTNGSCLSTTPCGEDAALRASEVNSNYWVALHASRVIQEVAEANGVPFIDINPTSLSRCDGHVGHLPIGRHGKGADCSHYCVPGVPDTWNTGLIEAIIASSSKRQVQ